MNFGIKYKCHKYHLEIILHTKFYLDQTIGKCSKPGNKGKREGGWGVVGIETWENFGEKMKTSQMSTRNNSTYQILS